MELELNPTIALHGLLAVTMFAAASLRTLVRVIGRLIDATKSQTEELAYGNDLRAGGARPKRRRRPSFKSEDDVDEEPDELPPPPWSPEKTGPTSPGRSP